MVVRTYSCVYGYNNGYGSGHRLQWPWPFQNRAIVMNVAMIMTIAIANARRGYAYAVPSYGCCNGFDSGYGYSYGSP